MVREAPVEYAERRTEGQTRAPEELDASFKRARRTVLKVLEYLLIAAGLLGTGFASAFITFTMAIRGNEVAVPNLIGASLSAAGEILTLAELNLRHEGNRFDENIMPDLVAEQSPPPGAALKKGRTVKVWTSLGPKRHVVPRVEGETLQSAQLLLEQEGFTLGRVVEVHSEAYAPDSIIAQAPAAYAEAGETAEVAVLVSRGYTEGAYVMPDFIGREISGVLDSVRRASLAVSNVRYVEYSGVAQGTVVRQTPAPGSRVRKRDRVTLFVSKE